MKKYGVTYIAYNERRLLKIGGKIYSASKSEAKITAKTISPERKPRIKEIKN